jgi:hypothetical protein
MSRTLRLALSTKIRAGQYNAMFQLTRITGILLAALVTINGGILGESKLPPRFADYKITEILRDRAVAPRLDTLGQLSGTDIRCFDDAVSDPGVPNYAGHYVVNACSCGSGCRYLVMWDAISGKVFPLPFGPFNVGPFTTKGGGRIEYGGEEYRLDSALLVLEGCREGSCACAKRYYFWNNGRFQLVRSTDVQLPLNCTKRTK